MDQSYDKAYWQLIWDKFKAGDRHAFEIMYSEFIACFFPMVPESLLTKLWWKTPSRMFLSMCTATGKAFSIPNASNITC